VDKAVDKVSERDPIDAELELLRDFFAKWENFHQVAKLGNRKSTEMAAQRMVSSATAYRNFQGFHASEFEAGHG
jgi:hypothetical protein